jgi:cobalt-zinc-cadmium efflux system protein
MTHHRHSMEGAGKEGRIIASIGLNFLIAIVEVVGGMLAGSLSLVSDALHNFSDAVSLIISLIAVKLAQKERTEKSTFGYKRTEILAALLNASILIVVSFFLFKEAISRLFSMAAINSTLMISVAAIGLIANLAAVFLLRKDARSDMNIKSAYLHLFLDTLSSAAVIVGGLCIFFFKVYWIDSALTILIGGYVLKEGYGLICDSLHILMQKTPKGINVQIVQREVQGIEGVQNIHHLHIWEITDGDVHLECHINLSADIKISESAIIKTKLEKLLQEKFNVNHSTFQFEYNSCPGMALIK